MSGVLLGDIVYDVDRCPQCGVASPLLTVVSKPVKHHQDEHTNYWWHFTAACSRCARHVLFYGWSDGQQNPVVRVKDIYPNLETVSEDLPPVPRKFLQQAVESKHAPDGAMMLAASSIDAMLKAIGRRQGSLFSRIEKAHEDGVLTEQMRDWAHEIRLSANEPRHADEDYDGATDEEANQVIQFAKALAEYLFVLPARVQKWQAPTKGA